MVIESITKFTSGKNATEIMSELMGYTYTFPREDKRGFPRDGREFSTMLNFVVESTDQELEWLYVWEIETRF